MTTKKTKKSNALKVQDWITPIKQLDIPENYPQPPFTGFPSQIVSIDQPFLLVSNLDGTWCTIDTRKFLIKKVSYKDYVKPMVDLWNNGHVRRKVPREIQNENGSTTILQPNQQQNWKQESSKDNMMQTCPRCESTSFKETLFARSEDWVFHCSNCGYKIKVEEIE